MKVVVFSDPHFAGADEKARHGWERRVISNPALRVSAWAYRRFLWLADPTAHNHQVDALLTSAGQPDWVIGNGDYSCDSAFIGVADDAACASARECLERVRTAYGKRLRTTFGDHELGKMSLFGGKGGLRLASWERATNELGLEPLWQVDAGAYRMVGVTSSLVGLPAFHPELLPHEVVHWEALRREHLAGMAEILRTTPMDRRVILFCHDPTALPFLAKDEAIGPLLPRIVCTVIGHLHSELVLRASRWLAGMPELGFLGNTARRLSGALRRARAWRPFRLVLCPSLAGVQLLKDGGYLELDLDHDGPQGPRITRRTLPWR